MSMLYDTPNGAVGMELEKFLSSGLLKVPIRHNGNGSSHHYPSVDVAECEESFQLTADVPGLTSGDIEVVFEKGCLVISGERKREASDSQPQLLKGEIPYGRFSRKVALPASADPERVTAELQSGVLSITVNKKASAKPRRITVKS